MMKRLLLSLTLAGCGSLNRGFDATVIDVATDASDTANVQEVDIVTADATSDVHEDVHVEVASDVSDVSDVSSDACIPTSAMDYCDGIDNDCDGSTDEDPTPCEITAYPEGVPCRAGTLRCVNGQPGTCFGPSPTAEICDGIDNDCNTLTDDNPTIPLCGHGLCSASGSCSNGQITCVPRDDLAIPEVCGNSIDDDCDNMVDEQPCTP